MPAFASFPGRTFNAALTLFGTPAATLDQVMDASYGVGAARVCTWWDWPSHASACASDSEFIWRHAGGAAGELVVVPIECRVGQRPVAKVREGAGTTRGRVT